MVVYEKIFGVSTTNVYTPNFVQFHAVSGKKMAKILG